MPDYEDLILQRQEEREILEDQCDYECDYCPYKRAVAYTERIDREPLYSCGLYVYDKEE